MPGGLGLPDGAPSVLVALSPAEGGVSVPLLQAVYGLSPTQAQLCRALADGQTFQEIATARGVSVPTMRSHLAEVLRRTGAGNLRDLLRMLGDLPRVVG